MKNIKINTKVYCLRPVYALRQYNGEIDKDESQIIFEVCMGTFIGYKDEYDVYETKCHILITGDTQTKDFYSRNVFKSKYDAEIECSTRNRKAFHYLGARVTSLEDRLEDIEKWAKQLNKK